MSLATVFLEPLDVLFLRGNKLFGDPGSYGESLVPPWPSVAAGALRSRLLADAGVDLAAFARGEVKHPELGTPDAPGDFAVTAFHLARRGKGGDVELLVALPADLVVSAGDDGGREIRALKPTIVGADAIASSATLPRLPVLAETTRGKLASGFWLTEAGWRAYLAGRIPTPGHLVSSAELWSHDERVGVGLEPETRRAADGRLFSAQAVAMRPGVGFLATIRGAKPPQSGSIRFGGDGRAAAIRPIDRKLPEPDYAALAQSRCLVRLVLTAPGLFEGGWLPTGVQPGNRRADGALRFELHDVRGWIVCAAVPRAETISGWDLARWQPKPAQRVAPTGSVYWLELDEDLREEALRNLAERGLWGDPCEDASRRAEGFNRFTFAAC